MNALLVLGAGTLLVLAVVWWIAMPLLRGGPAWEPEDPRAVALLAEREAALAELRDLDEDHQDGRLSDEDHARLRAEALARGAAALQGLDVLSEARKGESAALSAEIEAEVAEGLVDGAVAERGR